MIYHYFVTKFTVCVFMDCLNGIWTVFAFLPQTAFQPILFAQQLRMRKFHQIFFAYATCRIEHNINSKIALNHEISVSARAHAPSSTIHRTKTHLDLPQGGNN